MFSLRITAPVDFTEPDRPAASAERAVARRPARECQGDQVVAASPSRGKGAALELARVGLTDVGHASAGESYGS
jgi:hypothetical protein